MAKILDQRSVTWQQSQRAAIALVTTKLIESFVDVVYRFGAGASECELGEPNDAWQLTLSTKYDAPRVMVRTGEQMLYDAVRDTLRALGYEVRDKDDHLVVLI